ncbi:MAG TPA: hypothetical protein VGF24_06980 [Vicinamibacterales bacterium]
MTSKITSPLIDPLNREASLRAQAAAFREFALAGPPPGENALDLWMQHAAGLIFFEKVRAAGLATLESAASAGTRAAVELAVDAMTYALMMQIDGVSGGLRGGGVEIELSFGVQLTRGGAPVAQLDLRQGDGMCMGFHSWVEGDFGENAVVAPSATRKAPTLKNRKASKAKKRSTSRTRRRK